MFLLDVTKQAKVVIFSRKSMYFNHPNEYFNNAPAVQTNCTKNFGMYLDKHLNFRQHIRKKIANVNNGIEVIPKLNNILR